MVGQRDSVKPEPLEGMLIEWPWSQRTQVQIVPLLSPYMLMSKFPHLPETQFPHQSNQEFGQGDPPAWVIKFFLWIIAKCSLLPASPFSSLASIQLLKWHS